MIGYELSDMEDYQLHNIVVYRNGRTLYEYFVEMPLEDLKKYPKHGYRWWMGRKARSKAAMELRDYVLYWRLFALDFREKYTREDLENMSWDARQRFWKTYIEKVPMWAYEGPLRDVAHLLQEADSGRI